MDERRGDALVINNLEMMVSGSQDTCIFDTCIMYGCLSRGWIKCKCTSKNKGMCANIDER